jgi:SAM-dependent methyltransferase
MIPKEFNPSISSPNYIMRGNLLKAIIRNVHYLSGKLMDFGCGSKPYQSLMKVNEYVGVDFDSQGHSHREEQIDVFYDGKFLPFPDNTFDCIFSSEVFEHIFNLEEIMKELYRVLKPNGKIFVTCPFAIAEHEIPNDYARYTSVGLKHLFLKNNFRVLHFEKVGTNFEAVMHFRIMYYTMGMMSKLNRIKGIQNIVNPMGVYLLNLYTKVMVKILPKRDDLYLNNIIVCEKVKS